MLLLSRALNEAARIGLERVELEVFTSNHGAFHLYQRFGLHVEGIMQRIRKSVLGYDDLIQMAAFLGASGELHEDSKQD